MKSRKKVLVIGAGESCSGEIETYLLENGYNVAVAESGEDALRLMAKDESFSIILLALKLPDIDGLSLMKKIRLKTDMPLIVLSCKGAFADEVIGLELGADDYLPDSVNLRVLEARMRALLRRQEQYEDYVQKQTESGAGSSGSEQREADGTVRFDGWVFDPARFELRQPDGEPVGLTVSEFELLKFLIGAGNRVLTREELFEMTRGEDDGAFDRAIDIQIGRLRKKMGDDPKNPRYIKTVRGVGYMFVAAIE